MYKIKITLECSDSPLDEKVFDGVKVYEINVIDLHNIENLLNTIEPIIVELRGDSISSIAIKAVTESGKTILEGTVGEGFHGVLMS